jgi:cytidylate kinase
MKQPEVICISGRGCSGKTSLIEALKKMERFKDYTVLNYSHTIRTMALEMGITFERLLELAKTDHQYDLLMDELQEKQIKELVDQGKSLIIDSRLGGYFCKKLGYHFFGVYMYTSYTDAGTRLMRDQTRTNIERFKTYQETATYIENRETGDAERYKNLYNGYDILDPNNYNYMLNTQTRSKKEVLEAFLAYLGQTKIV